MEVLAMSQLDKLIARYPVLEVCRKDILSMNTLVERCFADGHRLYICGNGGSAADALHIVGELAKSFVLKRHIDDDFEKQLDDSELLSNLQGGLPAFALVENAALSTAFANDCNPEYTFAQQVYSYAREGDCLFGISTSGDSKNVIHAIKVAKARGAVTIGLTGAGGGKLKELCDVCVCVPETETYKIQELHLPVYHALCLEMDEIFSEDFFKNGNV
jgi:D-sedoheptulose 7-phosphate isomerase